MFLGYFANHAADQARSKKRKTIQVKDLGVCTYLFPIVYVLAV